MGISDVLKDNKVRIVKHYKELIEGIKGLKNALGNLAEIYFPKKKIKKFWIFVDLLMLSIIIIAGIDILYSLVGYTFGSVGIGNTMMVSEQGYFSIDDTSILYRECQIESDRDKVVSIGANIEWTIKQSEYDLYTKIIKGDYNLSKYSIPYSIDIHRIFYCRDDLNLDDTESFANSGEKELKDIVFISSLISCFNGTNTLGYPVKKCNSYPIVLNSNTSLIGPNNNFKLEITNLSFKYNKEGNFRTESIKLTDIRLNYIITKRVNRPFWYFTGKYISIIPDIVVPNIVDLIEKIKSLNKIDFI